MLYLLLQRFGYLSFIQGGLKGIGDVGLFFEGGFIYGKFNSFEICYRSNVECKGSLFTVFGSIIGDEGKGISSVIVWIRGVGQVGSFSFERAMLWFAGDSVAYGVIVRVGGLEDDLCLGILFEGEVLLLRDGRAVD